MAHILMLDQSLAFGPATVDEKPLGGAESAFTWLARALTARGHRVSVRTVGGGTDREWGAMAPGGNGRGMAPGGLDWAEAGTPTSGPVDMTIANRRWFLFRRPSVAGRKVLWLHNTAEGLRRMKPRFGIWRHKPILVTTSAYHRSTLPAWMPGAGYAVIPMAPAEAFRREVAADRPPPPRAIFTSNPVRKLSHLLDLWRDRIHPIVPGAELHLFGGKQTYQAGAKRRAGPIMDTVLEKAAGLSAAGVVVHPPAARPVLIRHLLESRVLLYPGSREETYCFAAAEAQALGVPAVLGDEGCLAERIIDGETGVLAPDDDALVAGAVRLLTDDALWMAQHRAALARRNLRTWNDVAADYEALL